MKLAASVTNTTGVITINVSESHNSPTASAVINAVSTSLDLGDEIEVYLGYEGSLERVFKGFVKQLEKTVPSNTYTITAYDEMIKATDYFIASSTPDTQYTAMSISAEDLVEDLLEMASITNYTSGTTYFTFGITHEIEVNLISSYDMCKTVADILAWHLWADMNGTAHFEDRKPYVMDTDSSSKTLNSGILRISSRISERELRNRIVVYGYSNISAVAEAESPYLPAGFRKSVVVASPWIDYQDIADAAANYNLEKLNRLTKEVTLEIIGDSSVHARQIVTISEPYTNVTGDWYVFSCEHQWSTTGYTLSLELRD
jgi:hypothetical protein